MSVLNMPTSQEEVATKWHRRLLTRLTVLEAGQLGAHEAGHADAWQFEHDEATSHLRKLEAQYPALQQ